MHAPVLGAIRGCDPCWGRVEGLDARLSRGNKSNMAGRSDSFQSYDPLAYYVNDVADLDLDVVRAHKADDSARRRTLLSENKNSFDVFICVNHHSHAYVLCIPVGANDPFSDMFKDDPFKVPDLIFCWRFELCYENPELRTYQIRKGFRMFKDIKGSVKKPFYIGRYKEVSPRAFQFSALRAAPHRYNAILNDCVEFAKEFCIALLSYCANWKELEEEVNKRIKEASATGLSIERLSRKVQSSGWMGSRFLEGMDISSVMSGEHRTLVMALALLFFLVYPVVVACLVALVFLKWTG